MSADLINNSRELPKLNSAGTEFFIDVVQQQFTQVDNPSNVILFDQLQDYGKSYRFFYNTKLKKVHEVPVSDIILVQVPSLFAMDPVGMAKICRQPADYYTKKYPPQELIHAKNIMGPAEKTKKPNTK